MTYLPVVGLDRFSRLVRQAVVVTQVTAMRAVFRKALRNVFPVALEQGMEGAGFLRVGVGRAGTEGNARSQQRRENVSLHGA